MSPFPQLIEEDFVLISRSLSELLAKSEATSALFVEKAGYLIAECGETKSFNTTELATLGANAFAATQFIADMLQEKNFSSMFQLGEATNVLWVNVDENSIVIIVFGAHLSVGAIKYYALTTVLEIAQQLNIAKERDPGGGIDLATLDPDDVSDVFQRKANEKNEPPPADAAAAS